MKTSRVFLALALFAGFCAGCGGRAGTMSNEIGQSTGKETTDLEKKTFRNFLERKLPDADDLQILEWSVSNEQGVRIVRVEFRAKGDKGNKVIWNGSMTIKDGKIVEKKAMYIGPDYGRTFTQEPPPGLDTGRIIRE